MDTKPNMLYISFESKAKQSYVYSLSCMIHTDPSQTPHQHVISFRLFQIGK